MKSGLWACGRPVAAGKNKNSVLFLLRPLITVRYERNCVYKYNQLERRVEMTKSDSDSQTAPVLPWRRPGSSRVVLAQSDAPSEAPTGRQ